MIERRILNTQTTDASPYTRTPLKQCINFLATVRINTYIHKFEKRRPSHSRPGFAVGVLPVSSFHGRSGSDSHQMKKRQEQPKVHNNVNKHDWQRIGDLKPAIWDIPNTEEEIPTASQDWAPHKKNAPRAKRWESRNGGFARAALCKWFEKWCKMVYRTPCKVC